MRNLEDPFRFAWNHVEKKSKRPDGWVPARPTLTVRPPDVQVPEDVKPPGVSTRDKLKHLIWASRRILTAVAAGEVVRIPKAALESRDAVCSNCELWLPTGNLGFGECQHPQCGCTKFKRGFATETCPLDKWESL